MKTQESSQIWRNSEPSFVAELTPHRSLGKAGFVILMIFVAVTCFTSGIMFLIVGAWPVFILLGFDVLLLWFAFRVNYRAAQIKERISVGREALTVECIDAKGRIELHNFNPFWSRFEVDRHEELGIQQMSLVSNSQSLSIGSFLNPDDKESFAAAFSDALVDARG